MTTNISADGGHAGPEELQRQSRAEIRKTYFRFAAPDARLVQVAVDDKLDRRQDVLRTIAATLVAITLLCFALLQNTSAAQGGSSSNAMHLLRKFALEVLGGVIVHEWGQYRQPTVPPQQSSSPPKPAPEPRISGYTFSIRWRMPNEGIYEGKITMRGVYGSFRVRTPLGTTIDQDMEAQPDHDQVLLIGSKPRYAPGSKRLDVDYAPDRFALVQLKGGEWTIADTTCDRYRCGTVELIDATTF